MPERVWDDNRIMTGIYDVIIIGAGPAGMTAGIYTARKLLKTLIISKNIGGQMVFSKDIENYPGFGEVDGFGLEEKFKKHLEHFSDWVELLNGVGVSNIAGSEGDWSVLCDNGESFKAKSIILACGRNPRKLGIPGESQFLGKGLANCSTCDAPLFKNKTVAVIGGGNGALDALQTLAKGAKKVYSVITEHDWVGDDLMLRKADEAYGIEKIINSKPVEIKGDTRVKSLVVEDVNTKAKNEIEVDGVFVEIGWVPSVECVRGLVVLDDKNQIETDSENMMTSQSGIFAAGDVNNIRGEQIVIAAGEGAKAALAVYEYLRKSKQA